MSKNLLNKETSPYLLQHKDNPIHWYSWCDEAFNRAEKENKPVLLSIGYAACHWCHVMAHESFEDADTANIMNNNFINIKLDREERPDLDNIYQIALSLLGQQGGWPLTMFLDSSRKPFWGGTYFPREPRHGIPAFMDVLNMIYKTYNEQKIDIEKNKQAIFMAMQQLQEQKFENNIDDHFYKKVTKLILDNSDKINGGLKGAPKFPQFFIYEYLLKDIKNKDCLDLTINTIDQICSGGIYDHVGGGISRYSVDEKWLIPHFEKMLYDNAQFIKIVSSLWQITKKDAYKIKVYETFNWLISDMKDPNGAFYASYDADSQGVEGKFYVWSYQEIEKILGDEINYFSNIFEINEGGNWEGANILSRYNNLHTTSNDNKKITKLINKLFLKRESREKPQCDNKILCDWNSLLIDSLVHAGQVFQEPKFLESAIEAFNFIQTKMIVQDNLYHSHCNGINKYNAMLEDYAYIIKASLSLFEATSDKKYLNFAIKCNKKTSLNFLDNNGMYTQSMLGNNDVIIKNKPIVDNVMPNANAVMIDNLNRLYHFHGEKVFVEQAVNIIQDYSSRINQELLSVCSFLNSVSAFRNTKMVIISGENANDNQNMYDLISQEYLPNVIIMTICKSDNLKSESIFYKNISVEKVTKAYICQKQTCLLPTSNVKKILNILKNE